MFLKHQSLSIEYQKSNLKMDVRRRFIVLHWCLSCTSLSSKHFKNFSSHTTFRPWFFYSLINASKFWHLWHPLSLPTSLLLSVRHHPGLPRHHSGLTCNRSSRNVCWWTLRGYSLLHPDLTTPQTFQRDWPPPLFCSAITWP